MPIQGLIWDDEVNDYLLCGEGFAEYVDWDGTKLEVYECLKE